MSAVKQFCIAAAGTLMLVSVFPVQHVFAYKEPGSAGPTGDCRMQSDKQATISACSSVIAASRDRTILEKAYNRRGLAYMAIGQFALAANDFTHVLWINSTIAGYFDNRQRALMGLQQYDAALRDANSAVKLDPTYAFVYHGRGAIYVALKRFDLAVQDFNAALAINANDAPLLVDRGKVYRTIGLVDNALADFTNAHSVDPNFMGSLRERGLTYQSLGNTIAARRDLSQVLASQSTDQQDREVVSAMQLLSEANDDASSGPALAFNEDTQSDSSVMAVPATPSAEDVRRAAEQTAAEQRRKAEQDADAARKEAQAARDEAASKLRKDRFDRISTSAKGLIDEASAFIKANSGDPKLLDFVQRIADLNSSLSTTDPEDAERKMSELADALQQDNGFAKFRSDRAAEQQRQNARYLADAVRTLAAQRAFVTKVVTRDPTSRNAIRLLGLIKEADAGLAAPTLDTVQTVLGKGDAVLQAADLSAEFAAELKLADQAAGTAAPTTIAKPPQGEPVKAGLQLVDTEKNAFLLKGNLQDVVFLFNTSPQAPHVIRNLRGDIVFSEARADVCIFGHDSGDVLAPLVKATLGSYETAKTIVVAGAPCDSDRLTSYDVIVTRRGTFMRQEPKDALLMVKAIESDIFQSLVTITDAQIKSSSETDAVVATSIAADIDKGTKVGFGLIVLKSNSAAVCVVAQDQTEAHRYLLLGHADKIATDIGAAPTLTTTSADGAFANAKRGQCGAIYAPAADLKDLVTAFKRDGVYYHYSSLWITPDEVKDVKDKLDAAKAAAEHQAADRQRREAEEQNLARMRAADEAAKLSTAQAASREQYASPAKSAAARIAQDVRDFMEHSDQHDKPAEKLFPAFTAAFRSELGDKWELASQNDELEDYGTSDFKGRQLETAFTRVTVNLKNRMLGDYKTECFVFGEIDDAEFSMRREPLALTCDNIDELSGWMVQHGFKSRWNLH